MSKIITRDFRFELSGPGQNGDSLIERNELVAAVDATISESLEFMKQRHQPTVVRFVAHSSRSGLSQWLGRSPRQSHKMDTVSLYVLPVKHGIHKFGLSEDGRLFYERSLRTKSNQRQRLWFPLDSVYDSRLSNDVLKSHLLWSLGRRD